MKTGQHIPLSDTSGRVHPSNASGSGQDSLPSWTRRPRRSRPHLSGSAPLGPEPPPGPAGPQCVASPGRVRGRDHPCLAGVRSQILSSVSHAFKRSKSPRGPRPRPCRRDRLAMAPTSCRVEDSGTGRQERSTAGHLPVHLPAHLPAAPRELEGR